MKKLILSAAALVFSAALFAQKTVADVAKFETETIDQGKLKVNEPKEVKFVVKNISKEPLIIEQANPTCGCTMGDYTKAPIPPGGTGYITAKYNAASISHFEKHLTVKFAGIDEIKSITIMGDVLSAEDYDKWAAENQNKKVDAVAPSATSPTTTPATAPAKGSKGKTKTTKTTTPASATKGTK